MINALESNNMLMLEKSMNFLWAKQAAHMDNVANAETPGYKVKTVTFEEEFDAHLRAADGQGTYTRKAMRSAIENSDWSVWEDDEVVRMDENGVDTTEQMVEMVRNAYQIQYVMQSISSDMARINTAIGS